MSDFKWDQAKDLENQEKHGVTFPEAQHAFIDVNRVIAEDIEQRRRPDKPQAPSGVTNLPIPSRRR
jgi:uncharacterized DUF497 family protein